MYFSSFIPEYHSKLFCLWDMWSTLQLVSCIDFLSYTVQLFAVANYSALASLQFKIMNISVDQRCQYAYQLKQEHHLDTDSTESSATVSSSSNLVQMITGNRVHTYHKQSSDDSGQASQAGICHSIWWLQRKELGVNVHFGRKFSQKISKFKGDAVIV